MVGCFFDRYDSVRVQKCSVDVGLEKKQASVWEFKKRMSGSTLPVKSEEKGLKKKVERV
jgi:hypothetical protein